jgi:hypothetical protein
MTKRGVDYIEVFRCDTCGKTATMHIPNCSVNHVCGNIIRPMKSIGVWKREAEQKETVAVQGELALV